MTPLILTVKSMIAGKASPVFASLLSGGISYVWATEALGSQTPVGVITAIVAASGAVGALAASWPKIIDARTNSENSRRLTREGETDKLIARIHDSYKAENDAHREKVNQYQQIAALERRSKHKALSECQRMLFHINALEEELRKAGGKPPAFHATTYQQIVGEEDEKLASLIATTP